MKEPSERIGAFEAKTRLSELLERVAQGATFTITKHDRPVARLVGYESHRSQRRSEAAGNLRALRGRYRLGRLDPRKLKEEGRA